MYTNIYAYIFIIYPNIYIYYILLNIPIYIYILYTCVLLEYLQIAFTMKALLIKLTHTGYDA